MNKQRYGLMIDRQEREFRRPARTGGSAKLVFPATRIASASHAHNEIGAPNNQGRNYLFSSKVSMK
jgi:hypothetical protein